MDLVFKQCFVAILIQGAEVQKDPTRGFHPQKRGGLVGLVMSVDELVSRVRDTKRQNTHLSLWL